MNLNPFRRSLNYNNIATYGKLPPINSTSTVTIASNSNYDPSFNEYNPNKFLNKNQGNGNWTKNLYYEKSGESGNGNYYEATPVPGPKPATYMEMQNPALGNMPNSITNANMVTGTVETVANHTELGTPVKQPVLKGPERPENPERLVKPSEVKRAKTEQKQRSLFNRQRRPLGTIQNQAAPAAGGSRKYRTKKVRKTRK